MLDHPVVQNLVAVYRKLLAATRPSAVIRRVHLRVIGEEVIVDGVRSLQMPAEDVCVVQEPRALGSGHEAERAVNILDVPQDETIHLCCGLIVVFSVSKSFDLLHETSRKTRRLSVSEKF